MFMFIVGLAVGLVIGWNFMEQPTWAKDFFDRF